MKRASCKQPLRRYAPRWSKRFFSTLMISNVKSTSPAMNYDCCGRRLQLCGKNWRGEDRKQTLNAQRREVSRLRQGYGAPRRTEVRQRTTEDTRKQKADRVKATLTRQEHGARSG